MSELTKAQAVNRRIAELCGYYIYHYDKDHPDRCYYMLSIPNDCHWTGWDQLRFRNEWGQWNAGERKTENAAWNDAPDYYNSLDESIEAAGELLNYGLNIYLNPDDPHITYKNGNLGIYGLDYQ
jgi:hypothetical protein